MENLFVFLISFTVVFLIFLINFIIKKTKGKLANTKEIELLTLKFKLNKKKLNYNALGIVFALVNSLIIASVGTVSSMVQMHYLWQLTIGFVLLMVMIYVIYGGIGLILKKRSEESGKRKSN